LGYGIFPAMAGGEGQDGVAQYGAEFDFFRYSQCKLAGCIGAVKPATKMFCVMMN
jgi:hypothetical protein